MYDIVALGEYLIDFTPLPDQCFRANPGGAPVNLLAAASRLGHKVGFIGKVGQDCFGDFLKENLVKFNIDTQGLLRSSTAPTTLAFVQLNEQGDRTFQFYRSPGADTQLTPDELPDILLSSCRLFHFGSLSLTHSPSKEATENALERVKARGIPISYDPNYRPLLWQHLPETEVRRRLLWGAKQAGIIKLCFEELQWMFPECSVLDAIHKLHQFGPNLVFITLGSKGSIVSTKGRIIYRPTYDTTVIDTTGAGDAFFGCALSCLLNDEQHWKQPTTDFLIDLLDSANAAGALCCSQYGAMPAMPAGAEIQACRENTPQLYAILNPLVQEILDFSSRKE
jgi:fructokinase